MDSQELRCALAQDSADFTSDLIERVIDALASGPGADGLPDLGFLPAKLQVMVLTALYRDFLERGAA